MADQTAARARAEGAGAVDGAAGQGVGVDRITAGKVSFAPATTVVVEPGPKVIGAATFVLPLAFKRPLAEVSTMREVPSSNAVPAAARLVVRVPSISHESGPLTTRVELAPPRVSCR